MAEVLDKVNSLEEIKKATQWLTPEAVIDTEEDQWNQNLAFPPESKEMKSQMDWVAHKLDWTIIEIGGTPMTIHSTSFTRQSVNGIVNGVEIVVTDWEGNNITIEKYYNHHNPEAGKWWSVRVNGILYDRQDESTIFGENSPVPSIKENIYNAVIDEVTKLFGYYALWWK